MGTRKRGFKMIRPEKYQFNWKPKTKSKEDLELVRNLEEIKKDLDLSKTSLTKLALIRLVKYHNKNIENID
jgi:hypothetical protein